MTNAPGLLDSFRGKFPRATPQRPSCRRRARGTGLPAAHRARRRGRQYQDKLGSLISGAPRDRQSPFALTRGNQFEQQVVANGMAEIVSLARRHLGLEIPEVRQRDLSRLALKRPTPSVTGARMNELRATLTRQRVEEMLTDPSQAYNLIPARHDPSRVRRRDGLPRAGRVGLCR